MTLILKGIHEGQKLFVMIPVVDFNKKKLMKAKIDMMKKIVFFELWKCDAYCKIKNICLQDKWSRKVFMNKKWGSCEKNLQRLESIINFNSPRKRLILLN
jgi:hypothetical protein